MLITVYVLSLKKHLMLESVSEVPEVDRMFWLFGQYFTYIQLSTTYIYKIY